MKTFMSVILLVAISSSSFAASESTTASKTTMDTNTRVLVQSISETRSTDSNSFDNNLKLKLSIMGDVVIGAVASLTTITNAIDDSGRSLIKDADEMRRRDKGFDEVRTNNTVSLSAELDLKNAARSSNYIKNISGNIQVYYPSLDPNSVLGFGLADAGGKPLSSPALTAEKVDFMFFNKAQMEAYQKTQQSITTSPAPAQKDAVINQITDGMTSAFMGGSRPMDDKQVAIIVKAGGDKIAKIEFTNAQGAPLKSRGSMRGGSMWFYNFEELPADAKIKVYLITNKSLKTIPINIENIPLP